MTSWLLGSLSAITRADVHAAAPAILLGLVPLWLLRWRMHLLSLADEEAARLPPSAADGHRTARRVPRGR